MGEKDSTGVLVLGPSTPYVSPEMLISAPTGISWSTIGGSASSGPKPTPAEFYAEILNICNRASSMANSFCNTTLRATVDSEVLTGPGDFRFQLQRNGRARLLLSRLPILSVIGGQWTPAASFPANFTQIPANQFRVEKPVIGTFGSSAPNGSGDGGQSVLLAPGIVTWLFGRLAYDVEVFYINGWPHAAIDQPATIGSSTLHVDDITGWAGCVGTIHSGGGQESVSVTSITPDTTAAISGPGTLNLSTPLVYQHASGTIITTLTGAVIQAVILLCVSQALVRGATATTVQSLPGSKSSTGTGPPDLIRQAKEMLAPYKRVI